MSGSRFVTISLICLWVGDNDEFRFNVSAKSWICECARNESSNNVLCSNCLSKFSCWALPILACTDHENSTGIISIEELCNNPHSRICLFQVDEVQTSTITG